MCHYAQEKRSPSLIIREMQIQSLKRYHLTPAQCQFKSAKRNAGLPLTTECSLTFNTFDFNIKLHLHIGLAKGLLWSLGKNKTHFSFLPRTLLNNIFILFYYLLPIFRQLTTDNSIIPKLFIFLSKELFQVPFALCQGIDIFSIKRIL